jgi:hypothetical protein
MRLIPGDELTTAMREQVLRAFVHRHLSGLSDDDWLQGHAFWFTAKGRLARTRNRQFAQPYYRAAWPFTTAPPVLLEI